jgi:hypothetical protein
VIDTDEDVVSQMGIDRPTVPWRSVLKRDPCAYCGDRSNDITIDHISPRSMGNINANYKNGAPACFSCNQAKGDRSLLMFLAGVDAKPRQPIGPQILLSDTLRRRAHILLGKCPGMDWWSVVADMIKARSLHAVGVRMSRNRENATWIVPVVSTNGVDLDLRVDARTFQNENGEIYCILLLDVRLDRVQNGASPRP